MKTLFKLLIVIILIVSCSTNDDDTNNNQQEKPFGLSNITENITGLEQGNIYQIAVFRNKLFFAKNFSNDVLSSANGLDFSLVSTTPAGRGQQASLLEFQNKLWLIENDLFQSSIDGITWTPKTVFNFGELHYSNSSKFIEFKDKLWFISGGSINIPNRILSSTDGINWVQETLNAGFAGRYSFDVFEFNNRLWLIGGWSNKNDYLKDIWSSEDGVNWIDETIPTAFPSGERLQVVNFKNKLYLISETGDENDTSIDIFTSTDGKNWTIEIIDEVTKTSFLSNNESITSSFGFKDTLWFFNSLYNDNTGNNVNTFWQLN